MSTTTREVELLANQEYKYGFVTEIEADAVPAGLNEDVIRLMIDELGHRAQNPR